MPIRFLRVNEDRWILPVLLFYLFLEVNGITKEKELEVNYEIRAREVRVIDTDGKQLGIMPLKEALRIAQERQLDLVKVAPQAKPPVCKIMDYGKYKYEQSKKEKEARKNQKVISIKEIRMSPNIEEHDFQVRVKNALRFLDDGNKVKVTIRFRGREITHTQLGEDVLKRLADSVREKGVVEKPPVIEGRNMVMILSPKQNTSKE
ncbi:bacterial translation initiation factor 3 (bIF-3) [Thermosediminibacter litoriperuensis]|uniref:Translation initiation factor IF-3 n=1 Tax=Thermosediminibacter litoriperuensis TaxID=291989 RepID=A0A5S5AIN8_9FIRM|nr:bacterial translation initiation factor 3 (bIF-3) [Thermosediminibacter litoriperuensis]